MSKTAHTAPPNFEAALAELETIVQNMEGGALSLEQSLAAYQRGIELLKKYCKSNPAQKVMVITAYASLTTAMESIKAGACDFLVKPLMHDEMKRAVRKALDKPR